MERTLRNGRYTLKRALGQGSQAETFEARDNGVSPTRPVEGALKDDWERYVTRARRGDTPNPVGLVAIKSFHVGRAKAWKDVELAEREARTLASLSHPNLPRYIEHFEEDGALYLVMEMVEGESLAAIRQGERRTSSVAEVTRMLTDIGEALRYLHRRAPAVVHRDIKPGNIIRRHDGSYALVDFGAVRDRLKPEGGSTVVGTFGYMAPEQFQGRASPRSDLYGLAATALVMLTGVEPEDLPHVGLGIDVAQALPSSTPAPLVRALTAMLDPDPDRRAPSIDAALAHLTARARPAPPSAPPPFLPSGARPLTKKEARAARRAERVLQWAARNEARRQRRVARRARSAPFLPRIIAQLLLLVARLVVGIVVALVIPLVLTLLSLVFGARLRRAAAATRRAARRADAAIARSSSWLSGHRDGDAIIASETQEKVRISLDPTRVRVPEQAPPSPDDEDEDVDEEDVAPKPARRRHS